MEPRVSPCSSTIVAVTERSLPKSIGIGVRHVLWRSSSDRILRCFVCRFRIFCLKATLNILLPAQSGESRSRSWMHPLPAFPFQRTRRSFSRVDCFRWQKRRYPRGRSENSTGYYAADKRPGPVMEVDAIHYRDNPLFSAHRR